MFCVEYTFKNLTSFFFLDMINLTDFFVMAKCDDFIVV